MYVLNLILMTMLFPNSIIHARKTSYIPRTRYTKIFCSIRYYTRLKTHLSPSYSFFFLSVGVRVSTSVHRRSGRNSSRIRVRFG